MYMDQYYPVNAILENNQSTSVRPTNTWGVTRYPVTSDSGAPSGGVLNCVIQYHVTPDSRAPSGEIMNCVTKYPVTRDSNATQW